MTGVNSAAPAPTPKRRHFVWRWTWHISRLGVAGIVLVLILAGWAWHERVALANALLRRYCGQMQVEIVSLEWEDGALHVREVSTLHLPSSKLVSSVGHLAWRPHWSRLHLGHLGGLKVEEAVVDVPLHWLMPSAPSPAASKTETEPPSAFRWRLDLIDLAPTKFVVRDENWQPVCSVVISQKVKVLEVGGSKLPSFENVTTDLQEAEWHGRPLFSILHLESEMRGDDITLKKAWLHDGRIDLAWLQQLGLKLPALSGGMQIEWEGQDVKLSSAGLNAFGTHEFHLKDLSVQPQAGPGLIKAASLDLSASQDASGRWHVGRARLTKPVIDWSPGLESALLSKSESKHPAAAWQARIDDLEVLAGVLTLSPTESCPVAGDVGWTAKLESLDLSPDGVRSALRQKLNLQDVSLRWGRVPGTALQPPFLQMKSAALEAVPDSLRELTRVESLVVTEPRLNLTPENGPWFDKIATPPAKPAAKPAPPLWKQMQFGTLTVAGGQMDLGLQLADRLEASLRFDVATEQAQQHLRVQSAQFTVPHRSTVPVLSFDDVEVVASLPEMWRSQRVKLLKVGDGEVDVGGALMNLFHGKAAAVETKADTTAARWTAEKIDVDKLGVTLDRIAPGLPPVRFDVNFEADETPLDLDGLAENVEPQSVKLTHLRIPSPHEPLRTVAEMNVIHVYYTLDGLLHRRIDRVDIVSPVLYVGEDLFWYVENFRKTAKGEPPAPDATRGPPTPAKPAVPGWQVETLSVSDGKLLIAPKGVPLAGISRPFPFSFTTKLESGQLDAEFDIPADNYTVKDMKLEFRGMKGQVHFNLPMKDRNNNLTETFTVEQLRWKQLHFEKAHLSITYDVHGIYGVFGSSAYGGYVNGAFDIYLDHAFTWDGWLAGDNVDLGPVTTKLFPEYLLIDGRMKCKVVATGNMHELFQGDVEFQNLAHGKFSISALNHMLGSLPSALKGSIGDQITRIGLETLRDFEYDAMDGKARFHGREGRGHLRFTGPHGSRKFDVNVYDHRWKEEPTTPETASATRR